MSFHNFNTRRSTVLSRNAAVATSDPIATEIGVKLLREGGNAADVAVGVAAALNVVDPGSTGLGGDCFVLFYDAKTKSVRGLNGSGRSPEGLTLELLEAKGITGHTIPSNSPYSVTVPGAPAAWYDTVEWFGGKKLSLAEILKPAIELACNGYPVHEWSAYLQHVNKNALQVTSYSHGLDLLLDGEPPKCGELMKNKHLARSFQLLASEGKKAFYEGEIARKIVRCVQQAGGCLTIEDMEKHESLKTQPISTTYRGVRVWEMPPNGQGIIALIALNILEKTHFETGKRFSAECLHNMIEALQLAFADGFKHIGDMTSSEVLDKLISKKYAEERSMLIQKCQVASSHYYNSDVLAGSDTVYFSVVDEAGNACSFINSIYQYHGSGLVPEGCGYALQNRGCNFSLKKGHVNCVRGGKRPYHTIIPGMATYADTNDLYACFGVMGGFMQPQGHVQLLINILDFGMEPQTAMCAPRFRIDSHSHSPPIVSVEEGVSEETVSTLEEFGHRVRVVSGMDRIMFGRGQIILNKRDRHGNRVLWSASDGRADGCASGY